MKQILLAILLVPMNLFAQFNMDSFSTTNQILVENAVKNCTFIVKQSFQIQNKKTKEIFGLGGKDVFGNSYSLGLKLANGCVLSDEAICPWNYNEKFQKYREDYVPLLCKSEFSELNEEANYVEFNYKNNFNTLGDSLFYCFGTTDFGSKGFEIDNTIGEKTGWIVWITLKKGQNIESSTDLNFIIQRQNFSISDECKNISEGILKPKSGGKILGGFYVVPYYSVGSVTFRLCGVLNEKDDKWSLLTPFVDYEQQKSEDANNQESNSDKQDDEDDVLTPIKKDKTKNKKK